MAEVFQSLSTHAQGFMVYVSHTSLLHSVGGTEKVMKYDMAQAWHHGYATVHVYSQKLRKCVLGLQYGTYRYGVLIQGLASGDYELTQLTFSDLKRYLKPLCHTPQYKRLFWHHSLNWHPRRLFELCTWGDTETEYHVEKLGYLHDFYTLCPSVNLRHHDGAYCGRLDAVTPADYARCGTCHHAKKFGGTLAPWVKRFEPLLQTMDVLFMPSVFMQQAFIGMLNPLQHLALAHKCKVSPHGKLLYETPPSPLDSFSHREAPLAAAVPVASPHPPQLPMGIVFIGASQDIKGWQHFKALAEATSLLGRYAFFHVATHTEPHPNITWIPYHHSQETDPNQPNLKTLLADYPLHMAYLGSLVPETYAFVLQEAKSLGLPVLTHPESGNIAYSIEQASSTEAILKQGATFGQVFSSLETLQTWLEDTLRVHVWLNTNPCRQGGVFVPYSETAYRHQRLLQNLSVLEKNSTTPKWLIFSTYHPENLMYPDIAEALQCYKQEGYTVCVVDTSPCLTPEANTARAEKQRFAEAQGIHWFWRENVGYDFTSYQYGLKWLTQTLSEQTSLLEMPPQVTLMNDSCVINLEALRQLLHHEAPHLLAKGYEVLGFTESWEAHDHTYPHYHLQSYWLCIQPSAWETLGQFFETLPSIENRDQAILYGELAWSRVCQQAGHRLGAVWSARRIFARYKGFMVLPQGTHNTWKGLFEGILAFTQLPPKVQRQLWGAMLGFKPYHRALYRFNPSMHLVEGVSQGKGFISLKDVTPLWAFTKRKALKDTL
jgi:hypothetical protein